jgi:hypothetical protein
MPSSFKGKCKFRCVHFAIPATFWGMNCISNLNSKILAGYPLATRKSSKGFSVIEVTFTVITTALGGPFLHHSIN